MVDIERALAGELLQDLQRNMLGIKRDHRVLLAPRNDREAAREPYTV